MYSRCRASSFSRPGGVRLSPRRRCSTAYSSTERGCRNDTGSSGCTAQPPPPCAQGTLPSGPARAHCNPRRLVATSCVAQLLLHAHRTLAEPLLLAGKWPLGFHLTRALQARVPLAAATQEKTGQDASAARELGSLRPNVLACAALTPARPRLPERAKASCMGRLSYESFRRWKPAGRPGGQARMQKQPSYRRAGRGVRRRCRAVLTSKLAPGAAAGKADRRAIKRLGRGASCMVIYSARATGQPGACRARSHPPSPLLSLTGPVNMHAAEFRLAAQRRVLHTLALLPPEPHARRCPQAQRRQPVCGSPAGCKGRVRLRKSATACLTRRVQPCLLNCT